MAPSLTAVQRSSMIRFMQVTGATESVAQRYLSRVQWRVPEAVDAFYNSASNAQQAAAPSRSIEPTLERMFDALIRHDDDTNDTLAVQSTMDYLGTDMGLNIEDASIFVALELLQAPSVGEITRKGYVEGWKAAGVEPNRAAHQAYLRGLISRLGSDEALFRRVYRYAFIVGKEPGQKALGLENAIIYWQMLFSPEPPGWAWRSGRAGAVSDTAMASADAAETPTGTPTTTGSRRGKRSSTSSAAATSSATQQSPSSSSRRQQSQSHVIDWLSLWTSYLQERWTRSVSRDMWNQTFEFALRSVKDPTLSFWSEDGAWPGVIDDFVVWYRKNASADETAAGAMEVDEAGGGGR